MASRGESKRPNPLKGKYLPEPSEYFNEFFKSDEIMTDMAHSFCNPDLPIEELEENLHVYKHILPDEKLTGKVTDKMANIRPRSECALSMEKLKLLTNSKLDRVADYVRSLVTFNRDGENLGEIFRWSKGLNVDQIAYIILNVVQTWKTTPISSSLSKSNLDKPRDIRTALELSLPFLLGVTSGENFSKVYDNFLFQLSQEKKIGYGPTPKQVNDALIDIGILRENTKDVSADSEDDEAMENENEEDEENDNYDKW